MRLNVDRTELERARRRRRRNRETKTCRTDVGPLLANTYDPDPVVRRLAMHELCPCNVRYEDDRLWRRMLELTQDPDRSVRAMAFHTITDGCPTEREHDVVAALEGMYQDPDLKIRKTIRRHLAQYRRTGQINIL